MKYFSLDSVIAAYSGNVRSTLSKFWGVMSILYAINKEIKPGVPYEFSNDKAAQFLEDLFSQKDKKDFSWNKQRSFVMFSIVWIEKLKEQMLISTPNFYDVVTWFLRNERFADEPSDTDLISLFISKTGLTFEQLKEIFSFERKNLTFDDNKYSEQVLFERLSQLYTNNRGSGNITSEGTFIQAHPGEFSRAPFIQTLYAGQKIQECLVFTNFSLTDYYLIRSAKGVESVKDNSIESESYQKIYFGAPGTGKSYMINKICSKYENYRTTFHPDTDYSSFVGAYKPVTKTVLHYGTDGEILKDKNGIEITDDVIAYSYIFQSFLKSYVSAWKEQRNEHPKPVFLVIEEINRGNCAQIFGDIFQLLDRNDFGFSNYPIITDNDLAKELKIVFKDLQMSNKEDINAMYDGDKDIVGSVMDGSILLLPNNLYIWATMNTSDQSLFPIDSAFKRRWDWKYVKITDAKKNYVIKFSNGHEYDWWTFVEAINQKIENIDIQQEDKKIGYFFVGGHRMSDGRCLISPEMFLSKVIYYMYNDVFKDFGVDEDFLRDENNEFMTYSSYFDIDGEIDESRVEKFVNNVIG